MESIKVKEALNTALMLGEVAHSTHTVEIDGIGEVHIDEGTVTLMSEAGEWKRITRENLDQRLDELMQESFQERVKRSIGSLVFNA
ncbi:MAG: hypothetical protein ABIK68_20785 [bacterium]